MTSQIKLRGGLSPSSITRIGTYEPWELQVARNQIAFHKPLFKFGVNPDVNGTLETVWDGSSLYVYPGSALAMTVTSAAAVPATDNGVKIVVQGLDGDYNEVSQEVTLAGAGTATTTQTFLRVFRAYVSGSQEPTGNLNITNGGTTYAKITLGENQTLMALWTVPAGYTAYLSQINIATGTANTNQYVTGSVTARSFGNVFRTVAKQSFHEEAAIVILLPIPFTEKTDIEVRAISSGSNNTVSADFSIIYIKNDTLS
jgi:hypothetical protein